MDTNRRTVRHGWETRQREHGNAPRAVLMKGLHPLINESIDRWHRDVVQAVFPVSGSGPDNIVLDVGCGFGRLADEVSRKGYAPLGIDFTLQFCVGFASAHGAAVCGDQAALPFGDGVFRGAYSVTSLMYLDPAAVRKALAELDRCLLPGGLVLILEPAQEFNRIVRSVLRKKSAEDLAMPGFTREQMHDILPGGWSVVAGGDCRWLTLALPLLAATTRWPGAYRRAAALARRLDRPSPSGGASGRRFTMYRWVACRKSNEQG